MFETFWHGSRFKLVGFFLVHVYKSLLCILSGTMLVDVIVARVKRIAVFACLHFSASPEILKVQLIRYAQVGIIRT